MRPPHAGLPGSSLLGLLLLAFVAGCAYYNTFFLAKKYYNEGTKAQGRSLSETPTPDAVAKYEAAIRQCDKLFAGYPKSDYMDDATYYKAASLYGKGDYVGAIRMLDGFEVKFPKSPYIPDARFTEGLSLYRRKEYVNADSLFQECDSLYPKFDRRWELYFYAGQCQSQLRNYPAATVWYGRAIGVAKNRRQNSDALRRDGDAFLSGDRPDTAAALYAQCLEIEERGIQRLDVAFSRAAALQEMGQYQQALDFLEEWKVFAYQEKRLGELDLRVFECLAALGRVEEAIQGYQRLVKEYPSSNVAFEAQFQIGYLYESKLSDYEAAGREYEKLRSQTGNQFGIQANRRAQNLATLQRFRQALAADTTRARAHAAFLLAEFYYFQMEKSDSALDQYHLVEREFPHSVYAPKSAFARLWITAYDRKDTLAAQAMTDTIASEYRGTRYAESALYFWKQWSGRDDERTALFDSLFENPDTSRMAEFEPEPVLPDTLRFPRSPAAIAMSAAERARTDSLRIVAQAVQDSLRLHPGGTLPQGVAAMPVGPPAPGAVLGPVAATIPDSSPATGGPGTVATPGSGKAAGAAPADSTSPDTTALPVASPSR